MTKENKSPFVFGFKQNAISRGLLNNLDMLLKEGNDVEFSPLSGSENPYEPHLWNNNPRIKGTHNCYAYVLNQRVSNRLGKPQPGYFGHYPPISSNDYNNCEKFYHRLKKDTPSLYLTKFNVSIIKSISDL